MSSSGLLALLPVHAAAPARGAPLSDIIPATIVAALGVVLVTAIAIGHRRGAFGLLARLSETVEARTGLPGWSALPAAVAGTSLLIAAFGFYWDVSWHIDRGRDPGPLANPAHWFIIVGLAGIALAGVFSLVLGDDRSTGASVRFRENWHMPIGGILLSICGVIALAGFPLDDAWHRIFGQDVTEWGPTHIQMIGGASLATLAMWTLQVEASRRARANGASPKFARAFDIVAGGAFLLGLSTLQGEFDYGVPQFRQLYHPILIMLAAGIALVAVRIRGERGSAVGAAAFFLILRGLLTLIIGPVLGRSTLHFPLYLPEALLVELVALRVRPSRQLSFGLWAGVAIGTVGLAAEWLWSHIWMPLPWHASLLPEAAILGFLAAVSGSVIGGLIGRALTPADQPRQRSRRGLAPAAAAVALVCVGWPLPMSAHPYRADMALTDVGGTAGRRVQVSVRLDPPSAADHANWFNVTAWQGERNGDGGLVIAPLHRVGPGAYRTTTAVPVDGTWKTLLRLQKDKSVESLPIYLPEDAAIPAPAVTADAHITRTFLRDKAVLQREAVGGSPALQRIAYEVLLAIGLGWIASLAWGLRRLESAAPLVPAS